MPCATRRWHVDGAMSAATSTRASTHAAVHRGSAVAQHAPAADPTLSIDALQMQRAVGNTAVRGLVQRMCADCAKGGAKCAHCHDEDEAQVARMQRSANGSGPTSAATTSAVSSSGAQGVPSSVRAVLSQTGSPLSAETRATMEAGFGRSFASVRVHTGAAAAQSAADVGALAYAVGGHIVFGAGKFAPGTALGSHLLAHELTHVVQQRYSHVDLDRLALDAGPASAPEREAEAMAARVTAGERATFSPIDSTNLVQRKMVEDEPAGGCGICKTPRGAGSEVHDAVQAEFETAINVEMMEHIASGDKKYTGHVGFVEQYVRGAPGDDNGFLDLAGFDQNGDIYIGEIKPANAMGLAQGLSDIDFYTKLIRKTHGLDAKPLQVRIDSRFLILPNPEVPNCPRPQSIIVNPPTPEGVYTYFCTPTRKELWKDPRCRCWPKRKKKEKQDEKRKVNEKDKDKNKEKRKTKDKSDRDRDDRPYPPPPIIIDGPPEIKIPLDAEGQKETPGEADERVDQENGESEGEGETGGEETGQGEGEGAGEGDGVGEGDGIGEGLGEGGEFDVFPGQLPHGGRAPENRPSLRDAAQAAVIAAIVVVVAKVAAKALGKRILAPLTAAAALLLIANGAEAKVSLKGDDPLEVLIETGGKKGIKLSPELEKAIRDDPKIMDSLRRAAATGDLSQAQKELSVRLTQTIVKNRGQFTDAELDELAKITDPKNGASIAGDATVAEIKRQIAAHKAGARPKGGSGGSGGGSGSTQKKKPVDKPAAPQPTTAPGAAGPGGGTVPAAPGAAQGQKGDVPAAPGVVSAPKEGEKGSGGGGGGSSHGDSTGATGPAVTLPAATTPATKLLAAWAQGGAPGPRLNEASVKNFLDWANSVSPALTDAEVEQLAPLFAGHPDKTLAETLQSVQDGLAALRAKKFEPDDASADDDESKKPEKPAQGGAATTGASAAKPKRPPPPSKPTKKRTPAPAVAAPAPKKAMTEDEKALGKHIAAFLKNQDIQEGSAHWILDKGTDLKADPSGKTAIAAWMYFRQGGQKFMSYVNLHPIVQHGKVWSFHIDAGASIYGADGTIVSTSSAWDTSGQLSEE